MTTPDPARQEKVRADLESLRLDHSSRVQPRPSRRRWLVLALAAAAVGILIFAVWTALGRTPEVTVATATEAASARGASREVLSGSGYVVTGERYMSIGVRVPGRIDRYFVEEGQTVRKDDPLVKLDDREYRAAVARVEASLEVARANLALAEAELERAKPLRQGGVISAQEFDVFENKAKVAHATVSQLGAELSQARVNLDYTLLRSPSDGVVLAKLKEAGEIAVPGGFAGSGDLVRVANLTDLRAEVDVNEADLNRVRLGQPAEVRPDAFPDARYEAQVVKLYPQVDRQKGTLKVEVRIGKPDGRLLPDMSARIVFLEKVEAPAGRPLVAVPAVSLRQEDGGRAFVWVVRGNRVHRTPVETGGTSGDSVEIVSGIEPGDTVVVSAEGDLADGSRVKVRGTLVQ